MGKRRPGGLAPPAWAVPAPLGVAQAATGREHVSADGTGDLPHRVPHGRGRHKASVREGGRRQRRSPTPGGQGQDLGQVGQGKPVKREAHGGREEGRGWPAEAGAPRRRQRRIRPARVDRPNGKAACAETCLLRLERGKGCKALPIATMGRRTVRQRALCLPTKAMYMAKAPREQVDLKYQGSRTSAS